MNNCESIPYLMIFLIYTSASVLNSNCLENVCSQLRPGKVDLHFVVTEKHGGRRSFSLPTMLKKIVTSHS